MSSDTARDQAIAQCASVAAMVAALECDYFRLGELRDERAAWSDPDNEPANVDKWETANPDDAEELAELESAAGDCNDEDEALQRIREDALSVEFRSGWIAHGEDMQPEEFRIVLCTGGPHVEIVGSLDLGEPSRPRVLYKDWGTSGELFDFDHDAILTYCYQFFFGE